MKLHMEYERIRQIAKAGNGVSGKATEQAGALVFIAHSRQLLV